MALAVAGVLAASGPACLAAGKPSPLDLSNKGFAAIAAGQWRDAADLFHASYGSASSRGNNLLAAKSAFNEAVVGQRLTAPTTSSTEWFEATRGSARRVPEPGKRITDVVAMALQSANLAAIAHDDDLQVKAIALAVSYDADGVDDTKAQDLLHKAMDHAQGNLASLVKIAEASVIRLSHTGDRAFMDIGYQAAVAAEKLAIAQDDKRDMGLAMGLMARLYGLSGRTAEALNLTSDALIWANQAGDVEAELELQIQRAALLEKIGNTSAALDAYQRATDLVELVRPALTKASADEAHSNLRGLIQAALFARADLMLRTLPPGEDSDATRATLRQVRQILELNKLMDLEFYFSAPCVRLGAGMIRELEQVGPGVAVIYPVLLRDRTEIIVGTAKTLRHYPSPVSGAQVRALAAAYEEGLQPGEADLRDAPGDTFMNASQALYRVLVAPALAQLQDEDVKTLVFAPDAGLRGAPLAALNDGKGYVIETYAVATALGLGLVDPTKFDRREPKAVLAGISQAPFGMPPLKSVPAELDAIGHSVPVHTELLDQAFTEASLRDALHRLSPNIVHLATHTRFYGLPEDNLLLTGDAGITPKRLGDMITASEGPRHLEILGLSACQTAVGDEDALLGIAGAAYQSGARSVIGSLWKVSDTSTARLMPVFYDKVVGQGLSKAEALREAQLTLLHQDGTRHPYHWAAFILLGNWL